MSSPIDRVRSSLGRPTGTKSCVRFTTSPGTSDGFAISFYPPLVATLGLQRPGVHLTRLSSSELLRSEPGPVPVALCHPVSDSIVETVATALPELPVGRGEPVSAPVRWTGRVVAEAVLHLGETALQVLPVGNGLRLVRRPGPQAAARCPRREVRVGLLVR